MIKLIVLILVGAVISTAASLAGVSFWTMALYMLGPVVLLGIVFKLGAHPMLESFFVGAIAALYCALMFEWHLAICIALGLILTIVLIAFTMWDKSFWIRTALFVVAETAICTSIINHFTSDMIWIVFLSVLYLIVSVLAHIAGKQSLSMTGE